MLQLNWDEMHEAQRGSGLEFFEPVRDLAGEASVMAAVAFSNLLLVTATVEYLEWFLVKNGVPGRQQAVKGGHGVS